MIQNPLSKPQIAELRKALANLNDGARKIERARAAGLDVSQQEARVIHFTQALQQLLDQYGPNFELQQSKPG